MNCPTRLIDKECGTYCRRFHQIRPCNRVCRRRKEPCRYILRYHRRVYHQGRWARQSSAWAKPCEVLHNQPSCLKSSIFGWLKCQILRSSLSQLVTLAFQSHVCRSTSKPKPAGQRTAAKRMAPAIPARSQRTTSRQSPSVESRKYSSGGLFSHSCSGVWAAS